MRSLAAILCLLVLVLVAAPFPARAADALVESAVNALALLTDPHRLEPLPEETFRAQLGPALGWLNTVRRRDVSPESVIARAFARNGLSGERARLTREALLRNLARADAWELFAHADSARALANGKPAPIAAGIHRGHFAQATVIVPEGLGPRDQREFVCLVLRADDENPPRPPHGSHRRRRGDLMARAAVPPSAPLPAERRPARRVVAAAVADTPPPPAPAPGTADADPLPVAYTVNGNASGTVTVREEVTYGREVSLAALGGPALRFVLRGADEGSVRFELTGDAADGAAPTPRAYAVPLAQERPAAGGARVWRIYEQPGELRISLYEHAAGGKEDDRTVIFQFPPASGERGQKSPNSR